MEKNSVQNTDNMPLKCIFNLNSLDLNHSTSRIWFLSQHDIVLSLPHNILIAETDPDPGQPVLLFTLTATVHGL